MHKKRGSDYYVHRHSCFLLQYHIVLVTKYRNPVLTGVIKDHVYQLIRDICEERGFPILELNGESDHLHLLLEMDPQTSLIEFINVIKTKTARFSRRDYPEEVGRFYWKPYFWKDGYFVTTVSENSLQAVTQYIQQQGTKN